MTFPQGWLAQNTPAAVVAVSPQQDAIVQLGAAGTTPPDQALQKLFSQKGIERADPPVGPLGALPTAASYFQAQTEKAVLRGIVAFVSHAGATWQLVGYTEAAKLPAADAALKGAIASFGPLADPKALAVAPAKVELVKVPRDMTLAEFNAQFPSTAPIEQVAIVNAVEKDGKLQAGRTAKRITGGTPGLRTTVNEAAEAAMKKK
jgi:predicted Zn-dependent protease